MVNFSAKKLSNSVTRIFGIVGEQMYLVEGKEKAALIDSGSGAGDLREFMSSLTDKPIIVLITHGHVDHAIGAPQFDEAYMSSLDHEIYKEHCTTQMKKWYLSSSPFFSEVTDEDYIPAWPAEEFFELNDGDIFDLGGISIRAYSCAGHSPGCMMMLIQEERTLIAGDACAFFTMLQSESCLSLSAYEQNLLHLKEQTHGKYDRIYASHGRIDPPKTLIDEVLDICLDIKEGRDDKISYEILGTGGRIAKAIGRGFIRTDGGYGNIFYNPERIF